MWQWLRHSRDYLVHDWWTPRRMRKQRKHFTFQSEQAGLTFEHLPIPEKAESVLIQVSLYLPLIARKKNDFALLLPNGQRLPLESLKFDDDHERHLLQFRLVPMFPREAMQLFWRRHPLGEVTLQFASVGQFQREIQLQQTSVSVCLGRDTVQAQTIIAGQSRSLILAGWLRSPSGLAPLLDLPVDVEMRHESGRRKSIAVRLAASQFPAREAFVAVAVRCRLRQLGKWQIIWKLGEQILHRQELQIISASRFEGQLLLFDPRFQIITSQDERRTVRQVASLEGICKIGPEFLLTSRDVGLVGRVHLGVYLQLRGSEIMPRIWGRSVLFGECPVHFAPGLLDVRYLENAVAFEVRCGKAILGTLPLRPVPQAEFNAEGGFKPPPGFTWTPLAEEELMDRLTRLMDVDREE